MGYWITDPGLVALANAGLPSGVEPYTRYYLMSAAEIADMKFRHECEDASARVRAWHREREQDREDYRHAVAFAQSLAAEGGV
jgi:hypothetical protein